MFRLVLNMNSVRKVALKAIIFAISISSTLADVIEIRNGRINGTMMQTRAGVDFHAFLKIPFAQPPVGELRFKDPVAMQPWSDVQDCSAYGPVCLQPSQWYQTMSEDCLHLNVFTKSIPSSGSESLKPVIVYIHGGGFGTGSAMEHGPKYLMERDVVVVTMSYRLGPFGFLALETSGAAGNQGLKDQSMALRWINQNIHFFGGDPERVTLAGMSAGGFSATAHMISPMSNGLFANVIAVSGALAWQKKLKSNNREAAEEMAKKLNCSTSSDKVMIDCFRSKTAEDIAENMGTSYFHCPIMTWIPVVETENFGQERFLIDEPNKLFLSGNFSKVNVIAGVTADEFIEPAADILKDANLTQLLTSNFNEIAPACFAFESTDKFSAIEISEILRKTYLPFDKIDTRSFNNLNKLFADGVIGYGVHRFVHFVSRFTNVFYYKFTYAGSHSVFKYPRDKPFGVHHADDIQYVFDTSYIGSIKLDDPENLLVERMTRIWENFAKTGNPNNQNDSYLQEMVWPMHNESTEYYLDIGNNLIEKNGLLLERYAVWDSFESNSVSIMISYFLLAAAMLLKFLLN